MLWFANKREVCDWGVRGGGIGGCGMRKGGEDRARGGG